MKNDVRGSITLEATIIIPFFLTLIIGLVVLVRIALVQIVIQNAADEAVKQLSAVLYPLEPSIQQAVSTKDEWLNSLLAWIPESIRLTIEGLLVDQLNESSSQPAMNSLFKPIYWHYIERSSKGRFIEYDQLHIEYVSIPYFNNEESMFGIEVRYEFMLSLPFYQRTIVIRKRAYERVWYGA